jgi:hypothetical protein
MRGLESSPHLPESNPRGLRSNPPLQRAKLSNIKGLTGKTVALRVTSVEALKDYKLKLSYETSEIKLFNVLPYGSGAWFGELRNHSYFKTVHVVSNGYGIEWEHRQDIASHGLYDMSV